MRLPPIVVFAALLSACSRPSAPPEQGSPGGPEGREGAPVGEAPKTATPATSEKPVIAAPGGARLEGPAGPEPQPSAVPAELSAPGISDQEASNWRLAESFYRWDPSCTEPWIVLGTPGSSAREGASFLARILSEFPALEGALRLKGTFRKAEATPGGSYDLPYFRAKIRLLAQCGTQEDCARLAWVVAVATGERPVLGCAGPEGWRLGAEVTLPSTPAAPPKPDEACARFRLCSAKIKGRLWACGDFARRDLDRCSRQTSCSAVQSCIDAIDWSNSDRLHPMPEEYPPGM